MKFSARNDIEAPIDFVFARAANFEAIERQLLRRGIDIQRTAAGDIAGLGKSWTARAKIRGRARQFDASVTQVDAPNGYNVGGATDGLVFTAELECIALSRSRTRVMLGIDVRPTTLTARLLLQSAKLAKSHLSKKFERRVATFCQDIEDRFKAQS